MHVLPKKNIYPRPPTVGLGQVVLLEAIFIGAEERRLDPDPPAPTTRAAATATASTCLGRPLCSCQTPRSPIMTQHPPQAATSRHHLRRREL